MTTSATTATTSTGSTNSAPLVINGLVSGIDTQSVITALLQGFAAPITDLQNEQSGLNDQVSDYGAINSGLQALLTVAEGLSTTSQWNLMNAASSNTSVATVSSSPGAQAGTASFTVNQLAEGNVLASQAGVASTGAIVTSASSLLVATGAEALGFSGLAASSSLPLGSHTIDVTQSSSAATVTGTSALASATTVADGTNDTLDLSVGGTPYALAITPPASGTTYTPAQLVAAINAAATTAGAGVTASLSPVGALQLSTNEQGSAASLSVTGGDALSALGLSTSQSATGTNAVVTVDGQSTTLSAITPGEQVTLPSTTGSVTATIASSVGATGALVSAGSAAAEVVSTGNGSLGSVVSAINSSGLALTASSVEDAAGTYLLQVSANSTGLGGAATVDSSAFSSGSLGSLEQISTAQNALVSVGGTGGYQLSSASDVFTNILAGTAVTVASAGSTTVTVSPDASGESSQVNGLVNAANQVLSVISQYAGYNAATKTGGPLMGSSVLEGIQQQILSLFATAGGSSGYGNSLVAGISLSSTGTLSFNSATFEKAFSANPSKVASVFAAGGTFSPSSSAYSGDVSFVYAGDNTVPGTYAVNVTQSATEATDSGSVLSGGTAGAPETLTIGQSGDTATYTTTTGESLTSIAAGLNDSFATNGLSLSASVVASGTQLELSSAAYGSDASFTVASSSTATGTTGLGGATANTPATFVGTDVVGTINGVSATGNGQVLTAPVTDPTLAGLSVIVTAQGISSSTNLGSFTYTPGLAQQLQVLANAASNAATGTIATTINGLTAQSTGLDAKITNLQQVESQQQTLLQNEFDTMETTLGALKNESEQVSSAINQLES